MDIKDKIYSFKNKTVREFLDDESSNNIEEFIIGKIISPDGMIQSLMYDNKDDIYNSEWIDKKIRNIGVLDKSVSLVVYTDTFTNTKGVEITGEITIKNLSGTIIKKIKFHTDDIKLIESNMESTNLNIKIPTENTTREWLNLD